jgi:hypothetical protein
MSRGSVGLVVGFVATLGSGSTLWTFAGDVRGETLPVAPSANGATPAVTTDGFDVSGSHPLPNAGTAAPVHDGGCGCRAAARHSPVETTWGEWMVAAGCLALLRRS